MYSKTIIVGRVANDLELRQTANGHSVTSFSLAVDRPYSTDGGQDVDFLNIVAWRGTAEFACRYFTKGMPMLVEGTIQTRKYTDKQGIERNVWEIVADQIRFVERKSVADQFDSSDTSHQSAPTNATQAKTETAPMGEPKQQTQQQQEQLGGFEEAEDSDDLPF